MSEHIAELLIAGRFLPIERPDKTRVIEWPIKELRRYDEVRVPIYALPSAMVDTNPELFVVRESEERIQIKRFRYNNEEYIYYYYMGYGPRTNTLVVGVEGKNTY